MRHEWITTSESAELKLIPETLLDKNTIEGLGNVTSARVKRNGVLTVIFEIEKTPVARPITPRPPDDVRDTGTSND